VDASARTVLVLFENTRDDIRMIAEAVAVISAKFDARYWGPSVLAQKALAPRGLRAPTMYRRPMASINQSSPTSY
jgi:hypothetical protein